MSEARQYQPISLRRRAVCIVASAWLLLGVDPTTAPATTSVEGESLTLAPAVLGRVVHDTAASGRRSLRIQRTGAATRTLTTALPSARLVVRARGESCVGAPRITVALNRVQLLSVSLAKTYARHTAPMQVPAGRHALSVSFVNDAYRPGRCDRNAIVDSVTVEPSSRGSAAPPLEPTPMPTAPAATSGPASPVLRWAPPAQESATAIDVPPTGLARRLSPTADYVLLMPPEPVDGDIALDGGRHVRIIGGRLNGSLKNNRNRGSLFVEGLEIDPGRNRDAILLGGSNDSNAPSSWTRPDLYVQNTRVTGVSGSYAGFHADVIQKQGPMGSLYLDKVTAETDYQGIFIPAQSFSSGLARPASQPFVDGMSFSAIHRTNVRTPAAVSARAPLLWLAWHAGSNPSFPTEDPWPIVLEDVYLRGHASQPLASMVWPQPRAVGNDGTPIGFAPSPNGRSGTWPASSSIVGAVAAGDPPGGDFAPEGVGQAYTSPGYR